MKDVFDVASTICILCLAAAFAFFVKWLLLFIKKIRSQSSALQKACRHSMEAICIFLSLAIASVSIIMISTRWEQLITSLSFEDYLFYSVLFCAIFLLVVFFRVLAPVFLGIYVLYCSLFALLFIHSYSSIPENFVIETSLDEEIFVKTITLSYKNLLPLPRYWVSEPYEKDSTKKSSEDGSVLFEYSVKTLGEKTVISDLIILYESLILDKENAVKELSVSAAAYNDENFDGSIRVYTENSRIMLDSF